MNMKIMNFYNAIAFSYNVARKSLISEKFGRFVGKLFALTAKQESVSLHSKKRGQGNQNYLERGITSPTAHVQEQSNQI